MTMNKQLRAIVIGAGSAGEGHALALRHTGVEVVAICARMQAVVQAVADRLHIPQASTDWRHTLETVKPDIIALATPARRRRRGAGQRRRGAADALIRLLQHIPNRHGRCCEARCKNGHLTARLPLPYHMLRKRRREPSFSGAGQCTKLPPLIVRA